MHHDTLDIKMLSLNLKLNVNVSSAFLRTVTNVCCISSLSLYVYKIPLIKTLWIWSPFKGWKK